VKVPILNGPPVKERKEAPKLINSIPRGPLKELDSNETYQHAA
jgi:hypothetical protein